MLTQAGSPFLIDGPGPGHLPDHLTLGSDPCRGRYMGFSRSFFFSFFFPPRCCPGHFSGTVTRRDSKLSVLLGLAV